MPPGEHSRPGTRSDAAIDPRMYQVLYELERRLDEKSIAARQQTKDDIASSLVPVMARLDAIDRRMADGVDQFRLNRERLDEHSDRIGNVQDLIKAHREDCPAMKTTALVAKGKDKDKASWVMKLGEKVLLPVVVAALGALATVWVMIQVKLVAFADTTTKDPTSIPQPLPPKAP